MCNKKAQWLDLTFEVWIKYQIEWFGDTKNIIVIDKIKLWWEMCIIEIVEWSTN